MKAKHIVVYLLLAIVSSSCIREEALNAEADILSCILPGVAMTTSPIINNNSITIFVGPGTDISELKTPYCSATAIRRIIQKLHIVQFRAPGSNKNSCTSRYSSLPVDSFRFTIPDNTIR